MSTFLVASFKPWCRYAVALDHRDDLPAIPFWTRRGANAYFERAVAFQQGLERGAVVMVKRHWLGRYFSVEQMWSWEPDHFLATQPAGEPGQTGPAGGGPG